MTKSLPFCFGNSGNLESVFRSELRTSCDVELLKVRAVVASWLQAIRTKLCRNVFGGALELRGAVSSSFQLIRGQKADVLHVAVCRKLAERESSGGEEGKAKEKTEQWGDEVWLPLHTARTSTWAPLPQNAFRS